MTLRPRYSLLTLLILTALVAGGIKLWRGPHQTVLLYPSPGMYSPQQPTAEQDELLRRMPLQPGLFSNTTLEYRCESINTRAGREYLMIRGQALQPLELYYNLDRPRMYDNGWVIRRQRPRAFQFECYMRQEIEEIHCWIFYQLNPTPLPLAEHHSNPDVTFHWPDKVLKTSHAPLYLVTKSGKVFDLQSSPWGAEDKEPLRPLGLAEITPGYLQTCIRRELQALGVNT